VVILAVHVVGDGAAERDVFGAWRDRHEPAARNRHVEDVFEADASLGDEHPGLPVDAHEAIEWLQMHHVIARGQAAVAVAAPIAERQR
jgi:hypothetical protein